MACVLSTRSAADCPAIVVPGPRTRIWPTGTASRTALSSLVLPRSAMAVWISPIFPVRSYCQVSAGMLTLVRACAPSNTSTMFRVRLLPVCRGGSSRRFCCRGTYATASSTPSSVTRPSQLKAKLPTLASMVRL
ncbi:hypothetical protein D3C78_1607420 [compost metagenome]